MLQKYVRDGIEDLLNTMSCLSNEVSMERNLLFSTSFAACRGSVSLNQVCEAIKKQRLHAHSENRCKSQ